MDQFLKTHKLPKLAQDKSLTWIVLTIKEIEFVVKNLPEKTNLQPQMISQWMQPNIFKEITPILHNLFQNIKEEGNNS